MLPGTIEPARQDWRQSTHVNLSITVAVLTVIVTTVQTAILWRQSILMDRMRQTAEKQANIADRQTTIAEQQHIIAYRPRLKVRHVTVDDSIGTRSGQPGITFDGGGPVRCALVVVNEGGSDAEILESPFFTMFLKDNFLPVMLNVDENSSAPQMPDGALFHPKTIIKIGEAKIVTIIGKAKMENNNTDLGVTRIRKFKEEGWKLYLLGSIRYRDTAKPEVGGHDRYMGFCRVWDGLDGFRSVNNPDLEYQD